MAGQRRIDSLSSLPDHAYFSVFHGRIARRRTVCRSGLCKNKRNPTNELRLVWNILSAEPKEIRFQERRGAGAAGDNHF